MSRLPLTPRQLAVLRWVAAGCPPKAWPDDSHKLSARALEARGLVAVSRRNGMWNAVLRPAGMHYLDHGEYPLTTPAVRGSRQPPANRPPPIQQRTGVPGSAPENKVPAPPARRLARQLATASPTEDLIGRIRAAGDSLTVECATDRERARLDAQVRAVRRFGKLAPSLQLLAEKPTWTKRVLTIAPLPGWMTAGPVPVPVPAQLRNPHPAVAALRDSDRLPVTGSARNRALRLLQALAVVAAERGYAVELPQARNDGYGSRERDLGHLRFAVRGHDVDARVVQLKDRSRHVPTARELADKQRYSWTRIPDYDYEPSDRLKLEILGRFEYQQSAWADGVKSRVEDKLSEIFRELQLRADAAERQRRADEERRAEEALEQQRRIARATVRLNEAHRADVLEAQVMAWQRTRQLQDYLSAAEACITQIQDQKAAAAAREWLSWARAYSARQNPLDGTLAMPPDPEPTPSALAPFLEGRSAIWYGDRRRDPP